MARNVDSEAARRAQDVIAYVHHLHHSVSLRFQRRNGEMEKSLG
jgi:hypothetical protein